jgi:hypothetical protein
MQHPSRGVGDKAVADSTESHSDVRLQVEFLGVPLRVKFTRALPDRPKPQCVGSVVHSNTENAGENLTVVDTAWEVCEEPLPRSRDPYFSDLDQAPVACQENHPRCVTCPIDVLLWRNVDTLVGTNFGPDETLTVHSFIYQSDLVTLMRSAINSRTYVQHKNRMQNSTLQAFGFWQNIFGRDGDVAAHSMVTDIEKTLEEIIKPKFKIISLVSC